jgi:hypothetical protein
MNPRDPKGIHPIAADESGGVTSEGAVRGGTSLMRDADQVRHGEDAIPRTDKSNLKEAEWTVGLRRSRGSEATGPLRRQGSPVTLGGREHTRVPSRDARGSPLHGDRLRALLKAAPGILRNRGFTPEPRPYRPRGWRSPIHVGVGQDGGIAVALPAPSTGLSELERRIGYLTGWTFRRGRGDASRPEVVFVLLPAAEPVRVEVSRVGRKPRLEVVRVASVSPVKRSSALKPFRQELRICVYWEAPGTDGKPEAGGG